MPVKTIFYLQIGAIILISQALASQNIESLYKQDTLYYLFKHKKNENATGDRLFYGTEVFEQTYTVINKGEKYFFRSTTHIRENGTWITRSNTIISRKHLRKRNHQMFNHKSLKKLNKEQLEDFYWTNKNKVIYLVDSKECNKRNITLQRVSWTGTYFIEQ